MLYTKPFKMECFPLFAQSRMISGYLKCAASTALATKDKSLRQEIIVLRTIA